jgi:hypothetical protein
MLDILIHVLFAVAFISLVSILLSFLLMMFDVSPLNIVVRFGGQFGRLFLPLATVAILLTFWNKLVGVLGADGSLPFYFAGLVGFVLLGLSVKTKHVILGVLVRR